MRRKGEKLVLTLSGPAYTLAECGKQLAWAAAALWPPARDSAAAHLPYIVHRNNTDISGRPGSATVCFDLLVQEKPMAPEEVWWSDLVGLRPVVVRGFPVHRHYTMPDPQCYRDADDANIHHFEIARPCGNIGKGKNGDGEVLARASSKCSNAARQNTPDAEPSTGSSSDMIEPGSADAGNGGAVRTGLAQQIGSAPSAHGDCMELALESSAPTPTDTPYESDLLSMSDPPESLSSLDQRQPAMPFLRDAIVRGLVSGYQAYAQANSTANTSSGTASANSSSAPCSANNPSGSSRPSKKRNCGQQAGGSDDDDDNDHNNNKPPSKRPKRSNLTLPPNTKVLACPFWKADSHRHGACFPKILSRIRDVKYHLRRNHYAPFSCTRCAGPFPSAAALHQHVSHPTGLFCTPASAYPFLPDRISPDQNLQIGRRSDAKLSEDGQWFAIWDIVFPGRPRPRSAYRDVGISGDLGSFFESCAASAEDVLDNAVLAVMATGRWPGFGRLDAEERRSILRWMSGEGQEIAFMLWRRERAASTVATGMGSGGSSSAGAMSVQGSADTPAGSFSLPDSGVVVAGETRLPTVGESLVEDAVSGYERDGIAEEEGISDLLQEVIDEGEGEGGEAHEDGRGHEGGSPAVNNPQGGMAADGDQNLLGLFGSGPYPWDLGPAGTSPDTTWDGLFTEGGGMSISGYCP